MCVMQVCDALPVFYHMHVYTTSPSPTHAPTSPSHTHAPTSPSHTHTHTCPPTHPSPQTNNLLHRNPKDPSDKTPVIVAGKDVGEVDNDYFLVPVKILDHDGPLKTTFPIENRLLPQGMWGHLIYWFLMLPSLPWQHSNIHVCACI